MVVGVCLVNVELGKEAQVKDALSKQEDIREVLHLFGEYDFIVIIETDGLKALNDIVDKIREIKGITATRTIIGAEF
ncbi:MAG: Lrp/AsnC ligand binding domain-containing protein [Methanobacteriota archaeon]|nr:Lrp/AsnC ligand binding domain-containing protein [Candidatus Hydrothermarchaeota archaeon]